MLQQKEKLIPILLIFGDRFGQRNLPQCTRHYLRSPQRELAVSKCFGTRPPACLSVIYLPALPHYSCFLQRHHLHHPPSSSSSASAAAASTAMSGFNLLHLISKSQPVALRPCGLPSGTCRTKKTWPVSFSQEDLRKRLTPMQFHVTQEKGTESAFRGELTDNKAEGTYTCVVCGSPLFTSDKKFDSGSGWPSFFDVIKEESIAVTDDFSYGMHRVETTCSQCGAHLGHLFDDGPRPTGKRYCINSASLAFQPKKDTACTPSPPADAEGAGPSGGPATKGKPEL